MHRLRIVLAAALAASTASAADVGGGKLFVNGYGSAGYGRTGANTFQFATPEGGYQGEFALAAISRAYEDVMLGAQFHVDEGGSVELSWAFGEWRLSDLFRLRAGQAKQPFGLYAETTHVGTTRPFYNLPASVYGPVGIAGESYIGLGATGALRASGWAIEYDVYGGQVRINMLKVVEALAPGATPQPVMSERDVLKDLAGARLVLLTPVRGLTARVSGFRASHQETMGTGTGPDVNVRVLGPAVEFVNDATSVRAEYYNLHKPNERTNAGYVELAQFLGEHVQLAARAEAIDSKVEGLAPSSFLRHREIAAGVNYWVNPDFVMKLSYEVIDGNRLAVPKEIGPAVKPGERTRVVFAGSQFSF